MKKFYNLLFLTLTILTSCSNNDYNGLIEKKEYEKAFFLSSERFNTTGDEEYLKRALFVANEYLEDAKVALPLLERYFTKEKSYEHIKLLASLTFYNGALSYYRSNKYDSAIIFASKAFRIKNNYAKALLLIGKSKVRNGDIKEGYADIEASLFLDSTLSDGYTFLGNIHLMNEEFEKAEYFYRKAIRADSLYYEGWMNLGEFLGLKKKYPESEESFRKALLIDSMRIDGYDKLINIFTAKNQMDSVIKYLDKYQRITGVKLKSK